MRIPLSRRLLLRLLLGLGIIGVAWYSITESGAFLGARSYHLTNPPSPLSPAWSWCTIDFQLQTDDDEIAHITVELRYLSDTNRAAKVDVLLGPPGGNSRTVTKWEGQLSQDQHVSLTAPLNFEGDGSYEIGLHVQFPESGYSIGLAYFVEVHSGRIVAVHDQQGNSLLMVSV